MIEIRALILAEVCVHREALAQSLARGGRLDVVGSAASVEEAVAIIKRAGPEIVLVDMPANAIPRVVRTLIAAAPEVKVIVLNVSEGDVMGAAEAGAAGYVARDGSIDDLITAVESVIHDEVVVSPAIAAKLFREVASMARDPRPELVDEQLTSRDATSSG